MKPAPAPIKLLSASQAATSIRLLEARGVHVLALREDELLLINDAVVAVKAGGFAYFVDAEYSSAQMRSINAFARTTDCPLVRVASGQFDFIVGSTLTKAGLPLTRRADA